ncbi:acetyl-CoA hydrolase/transferase C-terminal domain-containing protein [Arsenicicoccus cauae]|uniref:acetyl-CoA hydrolase/transferase C-terminal domain-containing protein n=2 Tax=Arsenicicoccus TaxID=267408 RepID=UPI0025969E56|nr:acetyl-CoA hydrolase/transferase C-terminal domain-containing protein [uncultured Arsenicicoccus sp.]
MDDARPSRAPIGASSPAPTTRSVRSHVVTDHGVAHLRGKTDAERAEALMALADPAFRAQLGEQAQEMHLL